MTSSNTYPVLSSSPADDGITPPPSPANRDNKKRFVWLVAIGLLTFGVGLLLGALLIPQSSSSGEDISDNRLYAYNSCLFDMTARYDFVFNNLSVNEIDNFDDDDPILVEVGAYLSNCLQDVCDKFSMGCGMGAGDWTTVFFRADTCHDYQCVENTLRNY